MRITILFDNEVNSDKRNSSLVPLWGFSAYIETSELNILFDTGSNGRILLHNARDLGVDLRKADVLFISHPHWDHIGGWDSITEINPQLRIIVPQSLSRHLSSDMRKFSREVIVVNDGPTQVLPGVFSTGTMLPEGEQALILPTDQGLILVAGCSHPRIENFVARAKEMFPQKPVYYVVGGFHLLREDKQTIMDVVQQIDTKYITPTHCTGNLATSLFREHFGKGFIAGGVGLQVNLPFS